MQLPSEKATKIVKERGQVYGHPHDNYRAATEAFVALTGGDTMKTPMDGVLFSILHKLAREVSAAYPPDYEDNIDDVAGYANVMAMVKEAHYAATD